MKRVFLRSILNLFLVLVYFQINAKVNNHDLFPRTTLEFYVLESTFSEGEYLKGDIHELGFTKYDYKEIPFNRPVNDRMISLRAGFKIDGTYSDEDLYVVVLPVDYSCKIFFNEKLLNVRGDYEFEYTNRLHQSEKILLPPGLINYNDKNEVAIQLYPKEGESYPLSHVFLTNSKDATRYVFYRNLLGPKLIFALSLVGFVFFVFYLIIYISRREYQKQQFLFFAFMNLFFVISYSNNIFSHNFSNTYFLEKLARVGFPMFIFVGICFLLDYTNLFKKKKIIKAILLVIYVPAALMVLAPNTTTGVINAYNAYPLISLIVGNFLLFAITFMFFLREKDMKSAFLFVIFLVNIIAGLHDGYYFAVLKIKPFILLTPNTVFGINLIIFFILAVDHSKLYHVALSSSEKLEKLNQELEVLVEKRTQKIVEYANLMEEANNTKDKFLSIIAHDLKNPFNTLIGYSDVLKSDFREYGQDEISQHLNIIYDTSVKGYNLLENLLQWSQSQTNKIIFDPVKINLHEIVEYCIDDIEHQSQFKDIDIVNEIPEKSHIIGDKNLLKTILRNLINNAVKYTPRNGMVSISSRKVEEYIEVAVKDTGIGMTKEELQDLFKIDKISSKPGTNKEKGSGLGLVLCKEFVEKHGGKIWVESSLDMGSIFSFTIPKIIRMN